MVVVVALALSLLVGARAWLRWRPCADVFVMVTWVELSFLLFVALVATSLEAVAVAMETLWTMPVLWTMPSLVAVHHAWVLETRTCVRWCPCS